MWFILQRRMRANRNARAAYAQMIADPHYGAPVRWDNINPAEFDGLLLPGGHRARGMREYLESEILQRHVASFFEQEKPIAAICHGVLLAARSVSPQTGRSVLHGYQTTALTWALENSAWSLANPIRITAARFRGSNAIQSTTRRRPLWCGIAITSRRGGRVTCIRLRGSLRRC
jgi:putative intracellular protease/amidase